MKLLIVQSLMQKGKQIVSSFLAAVTFYTIISLPFHLSSHLVFFRIARWCPLIGLLVGGILTLIDLSLDYLAMPILTRSVIVVSLWLLLTGGLHLDGVMDTADGLAVTNPKKRLQVMQDSVTGAFGVMAGVILLFLKIAALIDLDFPLYRSIGLIFACGWGRWAQVAAIAFYPYLKPTGKGAFHKQNIRLPIDLLFGWLLLWGMSGIYLLFDLSLFWIVLAFNLLGNAIALATGFWFYKQLGGHTGDTYGAVVEWTEALCLCFFILAKIWLS